MSPEAEADVCLILEGTYPYTMGGVSNWMHEVIETQSHLRFSIVALLAAEARAELAYALPANVVSLHDVRLQCLPRGRRRLARWREAQIFAALRAPLGALQATGGLPELAAIIDALSPWRRQLGQHLLLDSPAAWQLILDMYRASMPQTPFLEYFWSWRALFGGLFSVLLAPLPRARAYHAICTGYAGLMLARAWLETRRPCAVTEHGIYTNERRVEIASADWLDDPEVFDLSVGADRPRELKDFWTDTFLTYSRLCYSASRRIVTLYEGNQEFQRMDGADPGRLRVIRNGIDPGRYQAIRRQPHPPTVALIGRVVPIKDVKSFIRAASMLRESVPDLRALVLGPTDEDPEYAEECRGLVEYLDLGSCVLFTGKVRVEEHLGQIDVVVLTSLSEAMPLVILEAGAAGVPVVATDVGACREMILGASSETPRLGPGGDVVPLADPRAVANALRSLLHSPDHRGCCGRTLAERVRRYYSKRDQHRAYTQLYAELMAPPPDLQAIA